LTLNNELPKELTKQKTSQVNKFVPTLKHTNPGHNPNPHPQAHFFKRQFNIKLPHTPESSKVFAFFGFQKRIAYIHFFLVPPLATILAQLIILYLITLIIRTNKPPIKNIYDHRNFAQKEVVHGK